MNHTHYKVEFACDRLEEALLLAQENASPEEKAFCARLMNELVGIRDRARQELLDLHIKKAAPAVGATETANDSDNESIFSLEENSEDVKPRAYLKISIIDDSRTECDVMAHTSADAWALFNTANSAQMDLLTMIRANTALSGGAEK